jgi:Dynamin family
MRAGDRTSIRAVLDQLDGLAGDVDRAELTALCDRLDSSRLRVLVAGEAKRGKSTVANALLGRDVLPVGVTPLTAVAATVIHAPAEQEGLEVAFSGGGTGRFPLSDLDVFGTERGNPGNCRQVSAITVHVNAPILARGVEIVDTPGTGSVHAHNTAAADAVLPSMDVAIFVLTADPPVSASEHALLRRVAGMSVALFVVLNKADYLDAGSLAEAVQFTDHVVADATGRPSQVYPLSARSALGAGGDPGFGSFEADFTAYLESARVAHLEQSVTRHACRIAQQLLDEVALADRAARLPGEEAGTQVAAFTSRLAAVTSGRQDAEDRASAQSRRLLEALNATAEQAPPELVAGIGARMNSVLAGELSDASPADIQRTARAQMAALVAEAVESWRQEQIGRLEGGLRDLDRQLAAELQADLASVRSAAADLLGLELALPASARRLAPDLGFFYNLAEHVDQVELLAGTVRRRLPGEYGRRMARQRVLAEVPDLIGAQLGRARADLQYRLAEATRRLLADVRQRYEDATERLIAALERAARIRAAAGVQARQQLEELKTREQALRVVVTKLATCEQTAPSVCDQSDLCGLQPLGTVR